MTSASDCAGACLGWLLGALISTHHQAGEYAQSWGLTEILGWDDTGGFFRLNASPALAHPRIE